MTEYIPPIGTPAYSMWLRKNTAQARERAMAEMKIGSLQHQQAINRIIKAFEGGYATSPNSLTPTEYKTYQDKLVLENIYQEDNTLDAPARSTCHLGNLLLVNLFCCFQ